MLPVTLTYALCLLAAATPGLGVQLAAQQEDAPNLSEVLDRMKAHDEWQRQYLIGYRALRTFSATNPKFKKDATLEVKTTFRRPDTVESQILRAEGSTLIRERVFDKILEAEKEAHSARAKQQIDIVSANYVFSYGGREDCAGRACYRLGITPKRNEKYSIKGEIWVDAEDFGIVRLQGSPAKRPSFWTRQTRIDRRFKRIGDIWLSDTLESVSDVLIAGRSSLTIQYSYESIQTDPQYDPASLVAMPSALIDHAPDADDDTSRTSRTLVTLRR